MRLQELTDIAEKGLHLYLITKDPLTFSASKLLLQATGSKLSEPQRNALHLLQKQLAAYEILFVEPLM